MLVRWSFKIASGSSEHKTGIWMRVDALVPFPIKLNVAGPFLY